MGKIAKRPGLLDVRAACSAERVAGVLGCLMRCAYELARNDVDALQAEQKS